MLDGDKQKRKVENKVTCRPVTVVWRSLLMNCPAASCNDFYEKITNKNPGCQFRVNPGCQDHVEEAGE